MSARCMADNYFVTLIKDNTVYRRIRERELPDETDQHIIRDEEIMLTSTGVVIE